MEKMYYIVGEGEKMAELDYRYKLAMVEKKELQQMMDEEEFGKIIEYIDNALQLAFETGLELNKKRCK